MPFPEQRNDPCNSGNIYPACPIKKGEVYQFKAWFEVKPFYPAVRINTNSHNAFHNNKINFFPPQISIKVKYSLTDPTGQKIACVQVSAKIVDPNSKSGQRSRARSKSSKGKQGNKQKNQTTRLQLNIKLVWRKGQIVSKGGPFTGHNRTLTHTHTIHNLQSNCIIITYSM